MTQGGKLTLGDLKVQSFSTELDKKKESKIKGGCYQTHYKSGCPTDPSTEVLKCCIQDTIEYPICEL